MKNVITGILFLLSLQAARAQSSVVLHSMVDQLQDQYISSQSGESRTTGWTILAYNTQDRRKLDAKLKEFKRKYRYIPYEWTFEAPFYKLKVGAFRNRLDCKKFAQRISSDFPRILEVKAMIKKEDFLKQSL